MILNIHISKYLNTKIMAMVYISPSLNQSANFFSMLQICLNLWMLYIPARGIHLISDEENVLVAFTRRTSKKRLME